MKEFLFLDLDDTIFQTLRKCENQENLTIAAYLENGQPISYFSDKQKILLTRLTERAVIIPTTARSFAAFKRVNINFTNFAIVDFGGIILNPDGKADLAWLEQITNKAESSGGELIKIFEIINQFITKNKLDLRIRIIKDFEIDFYIVIKNNSESSTKENLNYLYKSLSDNLINQYKTNFYIHYNDNNLSVIPNFLNKVHAVKYIISKLKTEYGESIIWGMGDSLTDKDFMSICDYAIMPTKSQVFSYLIDRET